MKIDYGVFIPATALGALAGISGGKPSFDSKVLLVSVGILVVSLGVSRLVKHYERSKDA